MSTRAIIACAAADGTWRGAWNHRDGDTTALGKVLIRAVSKAKGAIESVVAEAIDGCPEGWSSFEKRERSEDAVGLLHGTFDGVIATCDVAAHPVILDAHLLYLFVPAKRRLYVFNIAKGPLRPYGMVTFEEGGRAKPTKLPAPVVED
jgi:hypothetical protein